MRGVRSGRRRSFRLVVAIVMVGVAMSSMLVVAVVNYLVTDRFLEDQATLELVALQRSRSQAIVDGLGRRADSVALLAADRAVVDALVEFRDSFDLLASGNGAIDDSQRAEIRGAYERLLADETLVASIAANGLEVPRIDALLPADPAAEYLQYHYFVPGLGDPAGRAAVVDPGDGSRYSEVHAARHPLLRDLAAGAGIDDLMLVTLGANRVVYTTTKGPDLAVDAVNSVFGDEGLGEVLVDRLARTTLGDAVFVDMHPYLGAAGEPVVFFAAAVRDGREVVGALVARLARDPLNQLMTAGGQWEDVGLGATGETYVVARDLRLRSDARGWIEDPDGHLRQLRARGLDAAASAIEATGSTVLVEEIDTAPVRAALDGASFTGRARNLLGKQVVAVATPLGVDGIDWVVVAEIEVDEIVAASDEQLRRLLLIAVVSLPAAALVGVFLARRLTRPVGPLVAATEAVAAGQHDVALDDPSRDEFGHVARELSRYARSLAAHDAELVEQHRAIDELLAAVLPERVVEGVRRGDVAVGDLVDTATVVAVTVDGVPDSGDDAYAEQEASALARALERCAADHGLERVWSSHDRHLFLAGLRRPDHGCDDAVQFVHEVCGVLNSAAETSGLPISFHAGLASGTIATAVVGGEHVSLGVWGLPVTLALTLDAVGSSGTVLVHESVLVNLLLTDRPAGRERSIEVAGTQVEVLELDVGAPV
jgi:HAMP domain-containing protein